MPELSCIGGRRPDGAAENCLLWGENPTHLVTRSTGSEEFCVNNKGDTQERKHRREEELAFSLLGFLSCNTNYSFFEVLLLLLLCFYLFAFPA